MLFSLASSLPPLRFSLSLSPPRLASRCHPDRTAAAFRSDEGPLFASFSAFGLYRHSERSEESHPLQFATIKPRAHRPPVASLLAVIPSERFSDEGSASNSFLPRFLPASASASTRFHPARLPCARVKPHTRLSGRKIWVCPGGKAYANRGAVASAPLFSFFPFWGPSSDFVIRLHKSKRWWYMLTY